ncbi:MAG TPA: hypothetical protein VNK43_10375 [Gemmatimonadales bacterium]|nr:hypothetical protein [Gemmatimonadales bacterium]
MIRRARRVAFVGLIGTAALGCGGARSSGGAAPPGPEPRGDGGRPGVAPGRAVTYRPTRGHYVFQRRDSVTIDVPNAGVQTQTLGRTAFLGVEVVDSAGGYRLRITLDSVRADSGVQIPAAALDSLRGTRWSARMSPAGELSEFRVQSVAGGPETPVDSAQVTALGAQLASEFARIFPVLPQGGATVGARWTDTTETPTRSQGLELVERSAVEYVAPEAEQREGVAAIRVESRASFTRQGAGTQFGQQVEMSGGGVRTAVNYIALDGRLLESTGTDSATLTVTVPAVGQSVPVHQQGTFVVRRIR